MITTIPKAVLIAIKWAQKETAYYYHPDSPLETTQFPVSENVHFWMNGQAVLASNALWWRGLNYWIVRSSVKEKCHL